MLGLFPGSGGPLDLALMSNIGPDKPLVMGDPSYEQGTRAAQNMKAPLFPVKLTADYAHDVKAHAGGAPLARRLLHREPQQPDRHDDLEEGHLLAGGQRAQGFGCDRR